MKIEGSTALVTGANRGLGRVYARELVSRGAARVYGTARDASGVTEPGVIPIALDITDPARVAQVAEQCADVTLLVNNAGVLKAAPKVSPESVARQVFDAVEASQVEVLADERTRTVKAELPRDHELIYPPVQEFWDAIIKGSG